MTPRAGPIFTPGALLAGFIKRITIHYFTQNVKALGLVVSEIFCFSHDAHGTTIYCYTQNMKAQVLVVSEKIFMFSHCKSMGANDPRSGAIFDSRGPLHIATYNIEVLGFVVSEKNFLIFFFFHVAPRSTVGRIYKEDHYTLLHKI